MPFLCKLHQCCDICCSVVFLWSDIVSPFQGSYGVVKLAYNQDDEQYYVMQTFLLIAINVMTLMCCSIKIKMLETLLGMKADDVLLVHAYSLCTFSQAMKVVSKKKLLKQYGFPREFTFRFLVPLL